MSLLNLTVGDSCWAMDSSIHPTLADRMKLLPRQLIATEHQREKSMNQFDGLAASLTAAIALDRTIQL
jgi:hypothetical protein